MKRPDVYAQQTKLRGSKLPHEMSYPTKRTLQYAVTPAQESAEAFHMFRHQRDSQKGFNHAGFPLRTTGIVRSGFTLQSTRVGMLTTSRRAHRMLRRAALKRRHVCFPDRVVDATTLTSAHRDRPQRQ
jgi:hypothetical protein